VSRKGANGPSGNDDSGGPALDADGSRVAFVTSATDFSAVPDANLVPDVWVRDVSAGLVIPVSVATGGAAMANKGATAPAINGDGTRVAFDSASTNLGTPSDVNAGLTDVFLRDLAAGTTDLVSRTNGQNGISGNGLSDRPSIDASGNRIAFETSANDLIPGDSNGTSDVFVRDLATNQTRVVSVCWRARTRAASWATRTACSDARTSFERVSLGGTGEGPRPSEASVCWSM